MSDINTNPMPSDEECKTSRCCGSHASLIISLLALALASYAVITAQNTPSDYRPAVENNIKQLEGEITTINQQINSLTDDVASNRENLVQTKLKKALQNIQDVSDLAEENTRSAIGEIEAMLELLTGTSVEKAAKDNIEDSTALEKTSPEGSSNISNEVQPEAASSSIEAMVNESPVAAPNTSSYQSP